MMPGSDADTIGNADELWQLVHLVQSTITQRGGLSSLTEHSRLAMAGNCLALAKLRALADQLDPENGRY